jgi:hypothetical protein
MAGWGWFILGLALGALIGYILKDHLTEEYVSNVTLNKPKVKGRGNKLDADQVAEVYMKKMTPQERRQARKEARQARKDK